MGFRVVKDSVDLYNKEEEHAVLGLLGMSVLGPMLDLMTKGTSSLSSNLSVSQPLLNLQADAPLNEDTAVVMVKVASESPIFIPPEWSVVVDASASRPVPFSTVLVELLRNSDHLPVDVSTPSTLVEVGKTFPVFIVNFYMCCFILRPNTRVGVLRRTDGVESSNSGKVECQISGNEVTNKQ